MDKKSLIKYLLIKYLSALLMFGLNGVVASYIPLESYEIVLLRTLIAGVFLTAIFLFINFARKKEKFSLKNNWKDYLFISLSGIAMGASWMFLYEAYQQVGVGIASLLYYCGPVIVMIMSPILFKEKLTMPKITGFIIVIVGIILVNEQTGENGINTVGLVCGGMSAVTYFFMVTFNKQAKKVTGLENAALQLVTSFLTTAVFVGVKEQFAFQIPKEAIVWILILGFVNTGIGCYLYFSSLSKLPVQTVAICGYLELVSAVVFSALLLSERMSLFQIIGAVCIIGGAMFGELVKK